MYTQKMDWNPIHTLTDDGFRSDLKNGKYCIGDPNIVLKSGFSETFKKFHDGVYSNEDLIFAKHTYVWSHLLLSKFKDYECTDTPYFTTSGVISIMSTDLVKPEFQDCETVVIPTKAKLRFIDTSVDHSAKFPIPLLVVNWNHNGFHITLNE
jgi:hypothetical protein